MGTKSNDSTTYWRTGIALAVADRPKFEERLKQLNLSTLGELVRLFTHGDGVIEALKAPAEAFAKATSEEPKASVRELNRMVKGMSKAELAELVRLAAQKRTGDAGA